MEDGFSFRVLSGTLPGIKVSRVANSEKYLPPLSLIS